MEEEIWTWMRYNGKLYEGEFQVSNLGNIRSVDRYVDCHGKHGDYKQFTKGHPLSTFVASQYLHTQIYEHRKGKHILIHKAVLESFVPNPDPKIYTDVNHKDENKLNNRLDNLEWCTKSYNQRYYAEKHVEDRLKNLHGEDYKYVPREERPCLICGKMTKNSKYCSQQCLKIAQRKTKRATKEELKEMIRSMSFLKIAKMYDVSDNTIRKWCTYYGLPFKTEDIKSYSDEEWSNI